MLTVCSANHLFVNGISGFVGENARGETGDTHCDPKLETALQDAVIHLQISTLHKTEHYLTTHLKSSNTMYVLPEQLIYTFATWCKKCKSHDSDITYVHLLTINNQHTHSDEHYLTKKSRFDFMFLNSPPTMAARWMTCVGLCWRNTALVCSISLCGGIINSMHMTASNVCNILP